MTKQRPEFSRTGLYILSGYEKAEDELPTIYIAFQFSQEVSERCEFCSKQLPNLTLLSLANRKNIRDISGQLFVVELPNDPVNFSYGAFQMVRGRNRSSASHDAAALLF